MASEAKQESTSREKSTLWWIAGVIAVAVLPYLPSLRGGFSLDDYGLIVDDPLAHSLANLPKTFLHDFLHGTLGPDIVYFRPLVTASYQANYMIAGPNPLAFRLTNLALNVIVALLVFALARRLLKNVAAAALAGMAFSVLPSHAEAVSWVSGRTDVMSCLFVLAAVLAFAKGCATPDGFSYRWAAVSGSAMFCGLLSKENALTTPVLIAIYVYVTGIRMRRQDMLKWAAAIVIPLIAYLVIRRLAVNVTVVNHATHLLQQRMLGVGIAYAAYLRMLFLPQVGRVVYDVFPIGMKYPPLALAAWLIPIGLAAAGIRLRRILPVVSFAALWVFVTLLPVSNILPTSGPLPAERFVYLPSVGSAVLLGWLAKRMLDWRPASIRVWPAVSIAIVCWYLLYGSALTVQSCEPYLSNIDWSRAVSATNGRFFRAWAGYYFYEAGMYKEAAHEYEASIEHAPPDVRDYVGLANAWRALGRPEEAIAALLAARATFGPSARTELNLGTVYGEAGQVRDAEAAFARAVKLDPKSAVAWTGLGRAKFRLGGYQQAVNAFERAASLAAPSPRNRLELGLAYEKAGLTEKAIRQLHKVAIDYPGSRIGKKAAEELQRLLR